jgi:hypothetical protein
MGGAHPARSKTAPLARFAVGALLTCAACAKHPSTEAQPTSGTSSTVPPQEDADRQKRLQTCVDSCTKVQLENPDESPYDCNAQCEELLNSIRETD